MSIYFPLCTDWAHRSQSSVLLSDLFRTPCRGHLLGLKSEFHQAQQPTTTPQQPPIALSARLQTADLVGPAATNRIPGLPTGPGTLMFLLLLRNRYVVVVGDDLHLGCHRLPPVFSLETKNSAGGFVIRFYFAHS